MVWIGLIGLRTGKTCGVLLKKLITFRGHYKVDNTLLACPWNLLVNYRFFSNHVK